MATDFSVQDKFNADKGFTQVEIGNNTKLLEVELNEMQKIQNDTRAGIVRATAPSGVLDWAVGRSGVDGTIAYSGGYGVPVLYPSTLSYLNMLQIDTFRANINGNILNVKSGASTNGRMLVTLPAPPTSGTRDDLVFLEAWFEEITSSKTVYKYGADGDATTLTNDLVDSRIGAETSRRVQLKWRIRTVAGVDFNTFVMDGFTKDIATCGQTSFNLSVAPQGGNSTPIADPWGSSGQTIFVNYKQRANYVSTFNAYATANDMGLYVAGDGSNSAKANLATVDGYVYAIPLFRVKRRNTGAYSASNPNGAPNYETVTENGTTTANGTVAFQAMSSITFTMTTAIPASFTVGKTMYRYVDNVVVGRITAVAGNMITVQIPVATQANLKYQAFYVSSERPDGLYNNVIDLTDITDLRHKVSLSGYNYDYLLKAEFDKFMRGDILPKKNLKTYHGVPKTTTDANHIFYASLDGTTTPERGGAPTITGSVSYAVCPTGVGLNIANGTYLSYPVSLTSTFTVDAIYKTDDFYALATNTRRYSLQLLDSSSNVVATMCKTTTANQFTVILNNTTIGSVIIAKPTVPYIHVRYTYDGTVFKVYFNGVVVYQTTTTVNTAIITALVLGSIVGWGYTSVVSDVSVSNIDRGATFPTLPVDFISGDAVIMPAFDGQRKTLSQAQSTQYTRALAKASNTGNSRGVTIPTQQTVGQWNGARAQKITDTVLGTITTAGNASVTITASGMTGSPKTISVAVALSDTATMVASKILTALQADSAVNGFFTIVSSNATLTLTKKTIANNDGTMSMSIGNGTCAGLTTNTGTIIQTGYVGDTITITGVAGEIIGGVIDGDTTVNAITLAKDAPVGSTGFYVTSTTGLVVGDTFRLYNRVSNTLSPEYPILSIDTTNKAITTGVATTVAYNKYQDYVVETTLSTSSPFAKFYNGVSYLLVVGTWTGLGTNQAVFTLGAVDATLTNQDIQLEYSLIMPTGQPGISEVLSTVQRGEYMGTKLVPGTVAVRDDFAGKTAGDTTANPNVLRVVATSSLLIPPAISSTTYEASQTAYNNIATVDGIAISGVSTTVNGVIPQVVCQFNLIRMVEDKYGTIPALDKVTWLQNNIPSSSGLKLTVNGFGVCPTGNKLYIQPYKIPGGTYDGLDLVGNTSATITSLTLTVSAHMTNNYIDANGCVSFVIYTGASDGVTQSAIYVDYAYLDVGLVQNTGYTMLVPDNPRRDAGASAVLQVNPVTKEVQTYFDADYTKQIVTYGQYLDSSNVLLTSSANITILAEISNVLFTDLGVSVGTKQGTHQWLNPTYRLRNDNDNLYGDIGFGNVELAEDSKNANTGAYTFVAPTYGFNNYYTTQYTVPTVQKPLLGIFRYLVLHNGELKLFVVSLYASTGIFQVGGTTGTVALLIPISGRPLTKEVDGIQRTQITAPTKWGTPTGEVQGWEDNTGKLITS